jgi:hypothetical protein
VDGRGVWDIPCVPDFTNTVFQSTRSDGQLVRAILEGRGAVMPPFRGTLTLEEGWGMARYLRTFIPGTEKGKPNTGKDKDKKDSDKKDEDKKDSDKKDKDKKDGDKKDKDKNSADKKAKD